MPYEIRLAKLVSNLCNFKYVIITSDLNISERTNTNVPSDEKFVDVVELIINKQYGCRVRQVIAMTVTSSPSKVV